MKESSDGTMIAHISYCKNSEQRKLVHLPRYFLTFVCLGGLVTASGCSSVNSKDGPVPTTTFKSPDGVVVTAAVYKKADSATWIVLCHQAGSSRGEYAEIAPKLMALGFNCLAVDARSGSEANEVENATAASAASTGKGRDYLDAKQDIESAVNYAFGINGKKVILFGSSYSASLALVIGAVDPKVLAVVAFSPGEYFGDRLNVAQSIEHLGVPTFVASTKREAGDVSVMFHGPVSNWVTEFVPSRDGVHGASSLMSSDPINGEYWTALTHFLKPYEHSGAIREMMKSTLLIR